MIRRALPFLLVPLAMATVALSVVPWLRVFPGSVAAVPLLGAAVLSVLVPVVVVGIGVTRLWWTALVDVIGWLLFTTLAGLHSFADVTGIYDGLVHGPSQVLSYALPLVSPATLVVAPVTLAWIAGAVLGECVARTWQSVLPYAAVLAAFGLAYAGSLRGVSNAATGRREDTVLAAALLLCLLLTRAVQAWTARDRDAITAQPDGVLPLRSLLAGGVVALLVAGLAGAAVQASAFSGPPTTPARTPPLDSSQPLDPIAFVAGLRPTNPTSRGTTLFDVSLSSRTSRYVSIADVDTYDGSSWSFERTFRPSGGVVPAETDPGLRAPSSVVQNYTVDAGPLASSPWLPYLDRPSRVYGLPIDVDATSGMVVPGRSLRAGARYSVRSATSTASFAALGSGAYAATSPPPVDTYVPPSVSTSLQSVVESFEHETGTQTTDPIRFLQALQADLLRNYRLSGGMTSTTSSGTSSPSATPSTTAAASHTAAAAHHTVASRRSRTSHRTSGRHRTTTHHTAPASHTAPTSAASSPTPSGSAAGTAAPGGAGTGFATVLASILGPQRSATPEQYATLVALVARSLGVPARVATGFRLPGTGATVGAGSYTVTTADAWTWVEVPVEGRGWVVLDAAPDRYGNQSSKQAQAGRPSPTPTPSSTPNGLVTQSNQGHAVAPHSKVPHGASAGAGALALIVLVAVLAVLVLALLFLLGRKRRRARRRRSSGDPRRRLLGAWLESLDVLVESGLPETANLTSTEVADAADERFGTDTSAQARFIGTSADAAVFSPSSYVAGDAADAAWRAHRTLRRAVSRELTLRQRVAAGLRYHRPPRTRGPAGPSSWSSDARERERSAGRHSHRRRH